MPGQTKSLEFSQMTSSRKLVGISTIWHPKSKRYRINPQDNAEGLFLNEEFREVLLKTTQ